MKRIESIGSRGLIAFIWVVVFPVVHVASTVFLLLVPMGLQSFFSDSLTSSRYNTSSLPYPIKAMKLLFAVMKRTLVVLQAFVAKLVTFTLSLPFVFYHIFFPVRNTTASLENKNNWRSLAISPLLEKPEPEFCFKEQLFDYFEKIGFVKHKTLSWLSTLGFVCSAPLLLPAFILHGVNSWFDQHFLEGTESLIKAAEFEERESSEEAPDAASFLRLEEQTKLTDTSGVSSNSSPQSVQAGQLSLGRSDSS